MGLRAAEFPALSNAARSVPAVVTSKVLKVPW
jgi:hypothetical protein